MLARGALRLRLAPRAAAYVRAMSAAKEEEKLVVSEEYKAFLKQERSRVAPRYITDAEPSVPAPATFVSGKELQTLSEVPESINSRTAIIRRPARRTGSRFDSRSHTWVLEFKRESDGWTNPIMGWRSSADPLHAMRLQFESQEAAVGFAKRQGYSFMVVPDREHNEEPGMYSYADNFLTPYVRNRMARGKVRPAQEYRWKKPGTSCWVNLPRSDYGDSKWKNQL
mmetsp:Transcript_26876/g.86418  ORF Transcript_26876/g.86418 Transcript_26876/m.86418 type:complete len:225 (-) Transcript_26876:50-724(-)